MLKHARQVWYSKFARSVAIVASGTAAAQIITIAFSPIITRLYGPEAFGILGTFTALLAILTPIAALSYPIAIVLPKSDRDALGLVKLSIKLGLLTSSFIAFLLLLAKEQLLALLNLGRVGDFIWFVPLAMLLSVFLAVTKQWVVRKKFFKLNAKVAVINALLQNSLKSGIGLVAPFAWVLVAVTTFGSALNAALYFFGIRKASCANVIKEQDSLSQKQLAKQHGDFAFFRTPQIVLNAASQSMPVLMLTALFGPASAGFYALGKMVLGAPAQLLGQSVQTVFYPHFNEAILSGRKGHKLLFKATASLAAIGIIPFGIVIAFGPWLFSVIFGSEWDVAGEYARWLALWSFVAFINRPSVAAIAVLRLQGFFLVFEIVSTLLRVVALYGAYVLFGTAISAVILFSLVSVFLNALLISVTIWFSRQGDKRIS